MAVLSFIKERKDTFYLKQREDLAGIVSELNDFCASHSIPAHAVSSDDRFYVYFRDISEGPVLRADDVDQRMDYFIRNEFDLHLRARGVLEGHGFLWNHALTPEDIAKTVGAIKESLLEVYTTLEELGDGREIK